MVRRFDSGTVHVFTYKTGMLSKVAHDLRLSLGVFDVELDGERVRGRFVVDALRVDGVMRGGRLDVDALSASDRATIERTVHEEILHASRFPEVTLSGVVAERAAEHVIDGRLRIMGREVPIVIEGTLLDGRFSGRVELTPSLWGIAPYRALLGAIKLQDRVVVAFDILAPPP